jgi:hypothetical protein
MIGNCEKEYCERAKLLEQMRNNGRNLEHDREWSIAIKWRIGESKKL